MSATTPITDPAHDLLYSECSPLDAILAAVLVRRLLDVARLEKISCLVAYMSPYNLAMRKLTERAGFVFHQTNDSRLLAAVAKFPYA